MEQFGTVLTAMQWIITLVAAHEAEILSLGLPNAHVAIPKRTGKVNSRFDCFSASNSPIIRWNERHGRHEAVRVRAVIAAIAQEQFLFVHVRIANLTVDAHDRPFPGDATLELC